MKVVNFSDARGSAKDLAPEFRRLPVDSIKTFPQTRGIAFEDLDVSDLVPSIRENGVHQPLLVCPFDGEQACFAVICGHRRLKAAIEAGCLEVPAMVRRDLLHGRADCQERIQRIQIEENLQRQNLTAFRQALVIGSYVKENRLTKSQASRNWGLPRTTLLEHLSIAKLSDVPKGGVGRPTGKTREKRGVEMEQAGKLDALSKSHLLILAERIGSPHFDILAERCFRGESVRKIKKFAAKLDSKPKPSSLAYQIVNQHSESFFGYAVRIAVKVEVSSRLADKREAMDSEATRMGFKSLTDFLENLGAQAVHLLDPESPRPRVLIGKAADQQATGAVETSNKPSQQADKKETSPGADDVNPESMEPPSKAAKTAWHIVSNKIREELVSWEFQSYLSEARVFGESGPIIWVALKDRYICEWATRGCTERVEELMNDGRTVRFIPKDTVHG